jgi:hypothetical protein
MKISSQGVLAPSGGLLRGPANDGTKCDINHIKNPHYIIN